MNALAPRRLRPLQLALAVGLLVAGLALSCWTGGPSTLAQASPAGTAEKQVTLLYTINNAGYTDTCG